MPKHLTQDQVDHYSRNGFAGPIDLLSADEALTIRNKIEAVEAEMGETLTWNGAGNFLKAMATPQREL